MSTEVVDKKKQTLAQIAQDAMALEQLIFEESGELSVTLEKWLSEVGTNLSNKVDNYQFAIKRFESSRDMLKERAAQITGAARTLDNITMRLKERIKEAMVIGQLPEISGTDFSFKLVRGADKVVIDEAKVEPIFFKERVVRELDKERLLQATEVPEGAELPSGVRFERVFQLRQYVKKAQK